MNAPSCFKPTQAAIDAIPAMYSLLRAVVTNRHRCFIPEDYPDELIDWTERAEAALAQAEGK